MRHGGLRLLSRSLRAQASFSRLSDRLADQRVPRRESGVWSARIPVFVGRRSECETLDRLLEDARAGRSGALVIRGEPGVGKTALLEYAIDSAADLRVARAVGVESEMELAYAALHQLCAPMLDRLERLPAP